jgi:thioredoxin-dependent peroxiredoxin
MKLTRDLQAPFFAETDVFDRYINLEDYRDKRLLIAFFRHAGCPFCNVRVHNLSKVYDELKLKGFEMIFFFESKKEIILRSSFHQGISPIPIIADPGKVWYDAYGLESSGFKSAISHITTFVQTAFEAKFKGLPVHAMADGESIKTMPAEFLIDRGLVIKKVLYSQRLNERMKMDDVRIFANTGRVE